LDRNRFRSWFSCCVNTQNGCRRVSIEKRVTSPIGEQPALEERSCQKCRETINYVRIVPADASHGGPMIIKTCRCDNGVKRAVHA
jgi:hypothetical protein